MLGEIFLEKELDYVTRSERPVVARDLNKHGGKDKVGQ